jgi:hypothetical protein
MRWKYAARAAVSTMLASMGGGLVGLGFSLANPKRIDILSQINGILGALVAVTGEPQSGGIVIVTCLCASSPRRLDKLTIHPCIAAIMDDNSDLAFHKLTRHLPILYPLASTHCVPFARAAHPNLQKLLRFPDFAQRYAQLYHSYTRPHTVMLSS